MNKLTCSIIPTALLTLALFVSLNPAAPRARAEEQEEKKGEHHKKKGEHRDGEKKEKEEDEKEGDETIEKVMKVCCKAPKGTPKLAEKVVDGSASEEETKKLIASYRTLKGTKPPQGELADWNKRIDALMVAVDALEKKEAGAAEKFDDANSCKSCHTAHRPKD